MRAAHTLHYLNPKPYTPWVCLLQALGEYGYFGDTRKLRITVSNMKNANSREALEATKLQVLQHLAKLPAKPSAQFQEVPPETQLVSTDWHTKGLHVWAWIGQV